MWDRATGKSVKIDGGPGDGMVTVCVQTEELCWGDAGLYLRTPSPLLGGSAVAAAGTQEQSERFLSPFRTRQAEVGRDGDHRAAGRLRRGGDPDHRHPRRRRRVGAERHEDLLHRRRRRARPTRAASSWCGRRVDKTAGRGGIKSFVVPAGTPGMTVVGFEKKLGIRASDTATLVLEDCRIPKENLLGNAEVKSRRPARRQGLQGRDGDLRRQPPDRRGDGGGRRARGARLRQGRAGAAGRRDPLRRAAARADRDRARRDRDGGRAPGGAAAHLARRHDDGPRPAQQPRGVDGEGQGRPRRHAGSRRRRSSCSARSATRRSCWSRSGCATRRSTTSTKARSRSTS